MKKVKNAARKFKSLTLPFKFFFSGITLLIFGWAVQMAALTYIYSVVGSCESPCNSTDAASSIGLYKWVTWSGLLCTYLGFAMLVASLVTLLIAYRQRVRAAKPEPKP